MPRITPNDSPSSHAQEKLDGVEKKLGRVPNIFKTMSHSDAVLDFYFAGSGALANTKLPASLREQLALTIAGTNTCDYCASAHTVMAQDQGVSEEETKHNLKGKASDDKVQAALTFAKKVIQNKGHVSDADVKAVKDAGYSEGEVLEIVGVCAINIFTNYINHVAGTEVDFPHVQTENLQQAAE
jgi:uncharacterized peroxidase-related enzyme